MLIIRHVEAAHTIFSIRLEPKISIQQAHDMHEKLTTNMTSRTAFSIRHAFESRIQQSHYLYTY